ncbi:general substrate transporter [Mycena galericulata]|nr:general substrate transporter [Mycena galericulata]
MPGATTTAGGVSSASLAWAVIMSAFAAFGGILYGYDTGTIGGAIAMTDWLETFGTYDRTGVLGLSTKGRYLKTSNKSLVVSILSAGTFCGALFAYPMGDIVGRKWGIVSSCCVFALGVGLQLDTKWATFIVGRFIAGLGVGLISCLVPMYQSECAPKKIRGLIVGLYQLAITIGALLAAIVLNATKNFPNHSAWRIPIGVQFAWAFVLGGGMIMLPESPRYLMYKGRVDSARKALARLTNSSPDSAAVDAECHEIELALQEEQALGTASYLDCFRNGEYKSGLRTWTGIVLQAVGVTVGQASSTGAVNLAAQRVLISFVCFYIAFFAISWGPVAWVIPGEIFSLNLRAKSMSLAVASNWLWKFGIGYATPYLVDPSTKGQPNGVATAALGVKVFFVWGSTCVGCLIFTYFFISETKGLSLEQIDILYKNSIIRGSNKYRKQMMAENETYTAKSEMHHTTDLQEHSVGEKA